MDWSGVVASIVGPMLVNIQNAAPVLVAVLGGLLSTVFLDVASGIYAAVRSGTFDMQYVKAFVKDHIWQQVIPIMGAYAFGAAMGGLDTPAGVLLGGTASTMLAAYEAATVKSILANFSAASTRSGNIPESVTPKIEASEMVELEGTGLSSIDIERIAQSVASRLNRPPDA